MKTRIAVALFAAVAPSALAGQPAAATRTGAAVPADVALEGFDQLVTDALAKWQVPGVAISVVSQDKVALSRGYGVRDPRTRAPMNANTLFPLFSITKTFTSFGVGLLVDEGKMSFDAPLRDYVPEMQFQDQAATFQLSARDMLSHRSGLAPNWFVGFNNRSLTRPELVRRLRHLPFHAPIRSSFRYNNDGYALVAEAMERASGVPWEQFTQQRILAPLGMSRSTISPELIRADSNRTVGVIFRDGKYVVAPDPQSLLTPYAAPAGGIASSAEDMTKWMLVHLGGGSLADRQIMRPETVAELHKTAIATNLPFPAPERVRIGVGLSWFTEVYRGEPLVYHGGNHWGISTLTALVPRLGLGVTVLANQDQSHFTFALMRNLVDRFMGASGRDWMAEGLAVQRTQETQKAAGQKSRGADRIAGTRHSRDLGSFAGTYSHPGYGTVAIRLDGGRLVADRAGDSTPLVHWHYDVFSASTSDEAGLWAPEGERARLSFISDPQGQIRSLQINSTEEGIVFNRQDQPPPSK